MSLADLALDNARHALAEHLDPATVTTHLADAILLGLDWHPCRRPECDQWALHSAWAGYCGEDCLEADLASTLRVVERDDPGYRAAVQRQVDDELTRDEARQRAGHHALADEHPTDWHDAGTRP